MTYSKLNITLPRRPSRPHQHGVVLIIVLILLVVISMLSVGAMSNAGSTERVMANVRTTELATQAAEMALRFCENKAVMDPVGKDIDINEPNLNWDNPSAELVAEINTMKLEDVNQSNLSAAYKRPPECMLKRIVSAPLIPYTYRVTARGFGPEVAEDDGTRKAPQGTVVWLQSQIELIVD